MCDQDKLKNNQDKNGDDTLTPLRAPIACPQCGKSSTRQHYPFCSSRCREIDLNRWLSGRYVLPGKPLNDENEE